MPRADRSTHASGLAYAGWWQRVGAELVDGLFVTLPLGIAVSILDVPATVGAAFIALAVFLYNWTLDSEPGGQTWGKRIVGIRVVADETGDVIGRSQGAARAGVVAALTLLGNLSLGDPSSFYASLSFLGTLDVLWPLWDRKRQTWHDKAAGSIVVRVQHWLDEPGLPPSHVEP